MKRSRLQLIAFALVFTVSCQNRGCSSNSTVYSEEREQKIGESMYTIVSSLMERTHYRKLRRTGSSFHVEVAIEKDGQRMGETAYFGDAKESTEPAMYLEESLAEATADGFTFRLVCNGKIIHTFNTVEGVSFLSPYGNDGEGNENVDGEKPVYDRVYDLRPDVSSVPLSDYPDINQFTIDVIEGNLKVRAIEAKEAQLAVVQHLDKTNLSEDQLITFFGRFSRSTIAGEFFKGERVREMAKKYPRWLAAVREKFSSDRGLRFDSDSEEEFVYVHLQDPFLVHLEDSIYLRSNEDRPIYWAESGWINNRIKCSVPFSPRLDSVFRATIADAKRDFPSHIGGVDLPSMIKLMHFYGMKSDLKQLAQAFTKEGNITNGSLDLADDLEHLIQYFEPADQKNIAKAFLGKLSEFSFSEKKSVVNFSARVLGCDAVNSVTREYMQKNGKEDAFWLEIDRENCQ